MNIEELKRRYADGHNVSEAKEKDGFLKYAQCAILLENQELLKTLVTEIKELKKFLEK